MTAIVQDYNGPAFTASVVRQTTPPVEAKDHLAQAVYEYGIERPRSHVVSYHYNSAVEKHHFGRSHPMKPWRLHLTKQLVMGYGLHYAMDCFATQSALREEMAEFHKEDYLEFLES